MKTEIIAIVAIVAMAFMVSTSPIADVSVSGMAKGGKGGGKGGGGGPASQCNDGLDNDGDGFCDYAWKKAKCTDGSTPGDSGCTSKGDSDETNCGDGVCEGGETSSSCSVDCGPAEFCGDGTCNGNENCSTCSSDCGSCPIPDSCIDSDGGFNVGTQGTVSGSNNQNPYSYTDNCVDAQTLKEWYCSGVNALNFDNNCSGNQTGSCVNGACT